MALPRFDDECFLISPIGDDGSEIRHRADRVRKFIVSPAVAELGLTAVRADEIAQPGQITLQVIKHVVEAKGAVADLTGANPNVFYELAIRHTAQLPVVLIAHELDRGRLPFDIAQMRTIFYDHQDLESADACKEMITDQLREALAADAIDSPVAASVNLARLQSGTASEQGIARIGDMVERVAMETTSLRPELYEISRRLDIVERQTQPPGKSAMEELAKKLAEGQRRRTRLEEEIMDLLPDATVTIDTSKLTVFVIVHDLVPDDAVVARIAALAGELGLSLTIAHR